MNWEVILWTCITLVVIMGIFGIIMSVISATNMKKRRENMRNLYEGLAIGNQVMFAGGIYGRVVGIEEETVKWEAPNISLVGSRFTVTETKEDSGKVIYYISDDLGDDVVLTLSSGAENYRDGMHADVYNDKLVYVKSDYGYQLMAYEFDDTLVEISCKYNFDTLKAIDDSLRFDL